MFDNDISVYMSTAFFCCIIIFNRGRKRPGNTSEKDFDSFSKNLLIIHSKKEAKSHEEYALYKTAGKGKKIK